MTKYVHYAPCVQDGSAIATEEEITEDSTKVTCSFCRSVAAITTPDPSLAEEKPAPAAPDVPLVHWSSTSGGRPSKTDDPTKVTCPQCRQLQQAVTDANRSVERAEQMLKRAALLLAERVDKLKAAEEALRKYAEEGTVSPSGSTESAEQAVPVPEVGSDAPERLRASQGLCGPHPLPVTFDGFGYPQYKPGPF